MAKKISIGNVVSGVASVLFWIGGASEAQALTSLGSWLPQAATVSLWMVPLDTSPAAPHPGDSSGVNAVFPVPSSTPDLTFSTNLIQYSSESKPNTIQGFFVPGSVMNPVFSNLFNPQVGAIVDPNTLLTYGGWQESSCLAGSCWGTYMEISGSIYLENGGHVKIEHDDGVSLKFNGVTTDCFSDASGNHYLAATSVESCIYNGPSGLVSFDLVYTEGYWDPVGLNTAKLSFAVPEPGSFALMTLGLFSIVGLSRRKL